jgi:hypothetical protein
MIRKSFLLKNLKKKNKSLYCKKKQISLLRHFDLVLFIDFPRDFLKKTIKIEKLVKKAKIIRKTGNKHLFKKPLKKQQKKSSFKFHTLNIYTLIP